MKYSQDQKELESRAQVESEIVYAGKVLTLKRETLQFDSLPPHHWEIIEHPGAVAIIPINKEGKLFLIQQWRRAIQKIIYEIPAGTLDGKESPLECAQRELQEEIGFRAEKFIPMGGIFSAPGFCTEYIHLFLALDLIASPLPKDLHEAIDLVELGFEDALSLIDTHQIQDAKTVSGILRAKRWMKKNA